MSSCVLDDLIALLRNFPSCRYSGALDAHIYFFKDLGMASIDAVVLAEMLEQFYGQKFPFSSFMKTLQEKSVRDLQLQELAEFIEKNLKVS